MLGSLENGQFFSEYEITRLRELGLWQESHTTPEKLAFGALMLAPIMQVDMQNRSVSSSEFSAIEEYVRRIESDFEIATEEDLESIGTDMGLLPMVQSTWNTEKYLTARALLAGALERLTEKEAHHVRNAVAKATLDVARAGTGHIIGIHRIHKLEKPLLHQIVHELRLETTSEGLHLLGQSEDH
jgi:hypothetical protein